MFYFKVANDVVEKYQVSFNKEEIEKLKKEIIRNCSNIVHREYYNESMPHFIDKSLIFNFHSIYIGEKEYFEETKDIYLFTFDEYEVPYLVKLIARLLKEDSSVLEEILNYKEEEKVAIDEKINFVNQEYLKESNIFKRKEKLKELESLLNEKDLNKNQQSTYLYYAKLLSFLNFELVDTLSLKDIKRVEDFYTNRAKNLSKALKKN